jgi:hypothetical protein
MEPMKRCRQCRQVKPLTEFVANPRKDLLDASNKSDVTDPRNYRPRCSVCEITNRTEPKNDRRERHKARDTRRRHAERFGIPQAELEDYHGWQLDPMEADIIEIRDHGCRRCRVIEGGVVVYNYTPSGLDDIHLDIIDPNEPPFYGINTEWVCATCNLRKGPRTAMRLRIEQAEREAKARRANRPGQLALFDP